MPDVGAEPIGWLETVTIAGSDHPVRVTLEARDGAQVLLRQVDPDEPEPPRVPLDAGDQIAVMQAISHLGPHTSDVIGEVADLVTSWRVVPVRREGNMVYARTLRHDEQDPGTRVHLRPGDQLTLEAGAIAAQLDQLDAIEPPTASGYVPLTPVLATWFMIGHDESHLTRARYLLAAARRLDAANARLEQVGEHRLQLAEDGLTGPSIRRTLLSLIGDVEMAVVALGRALDMVTKARQAIGAAIDVPDEITAAIQDVTEIRNAYEHIEDRAQGRVRGKPHRDAVTVFDYRDLIDHDRITYSSHQLDLQHQVPDLVAAARDFLKSAAAE